MIYSQFAVVLEVQAELARVRQLQSAHVALTESTLTTSIDRLHTVIYAVVKIP